MVNAFSKANVDHCSLHLNVCPPFNGCNVLTTAIGTIATNDPNQMIAIILYACLLHCHCRDVSGWQMAKYLSTDTETNVYAETHTETALNTWETMS